MWEGFLLSLLAGCLYSLAGIRLQRWHQRGALNAMREAAVACGLHPEESSTPPGFFRARLKARAEPLEVKIEQVYQGNGASFGISVAVPGPPGFSGVRIVRETERPRSAHEIEIGDEPFDSAFYLQGPTRLLHALLDAEVRHLLISVNAESRFEIVGGELRASVVHRYQTAEILRLLLEIGQRFAQPLDALQRLASNATSDPDAGVRLGNLLVLAREEPGNPVAVEALRAACLDPSPEIRLRAAQELGAEGRKVLLELAESEVNDTWSARAVSALGRNLPFDLAATLLNVALRRRRLLTAHACLEALGRSGSAETIHLLAKVLAREEGNLAAAAALALGRTGSPAAESPLIGALQHESTEVLTAAANALGEVGTAAAVLPLKEVTKRSSHHPELLRATRQAIAAIQSRFPGASPGQLSLSGADVGQLSLIPAGAGQLSLASDPAGQLSLPAGEAGQLSLDGSEGRPVE
jgi:HEAT repeat protein